MWLVVGFAVLVVLGVVAFLIYRFKYANKSTLESIMGGSYQELQEEGSVSKYKTGRL